MAHTAGKIIQGSYFDSVTLMLVARDVLALPGVKDAAAIMATGENKRILAASGMDWPGLKEAGDTDLALGVLAESQEAAEAAVTEAQALLDKRKSASGSATAYQPRSLDAAIEQDSESNLVLISVAGRYAAGEAMTALQAGKNVMMFSDNVALDDEIALKQFAQEKGLLVMGPDCGTAIIGGIPLAFANVVRRGPIGIVAASGTGLQEVSSFIHNLGSGVSHAIGTGGRDIKSDVGGLTFLSALTALKEDPDTQVVVLVSKTPDADVLERIGKAVANLGKPAVAIFIGADPEVVAKSGAIPAQTLEEAARRAVALAEGKALSDAELACPPLPDSIQRREGGRYVRGLFCGGTFSQEAVHLLKPVLGDICTNVTGELEDPDHSAGHTIIDMGGDEFTAGRPHPMIDYSLRNKRIVQEAQDPETAVILIDVVLGFGSNMNPATELQPVLEEVRALDNPPPIVFHVCGTDADPQQRNATVQRLRDAGGIWAESNAIAVQWAGQLIEEQQ